MKNSPVKLGFLYEKNWGVFFLHTSQIDYQKTCQKSSSVSCERQGLFEVKGHEKIKLVKI